jgi:hypothetical protein
MELVRRALSPRVESALAALEVLGKGLVPLGGVSFLVPFSA